jgi:RNA polymerase sigma factor (sigma-70 family)
MTDGQLLHAFVRLRDQDALAALVHRHGPMVWGVCRRLLRSHQDAEDAFQATFLVLVHKAAAVRDKETVANWLYGVAHQTAVRVRAAMTKRQGREQPMTDMAEPAAKEADVGDDLLLILDQELSRLPDKYRVLIVLCDLEGKTRKEVALRLGCPEGTVAGRLARARTMLANRLRKRGLAITGGALAAILSQEMASACVPASVVTSTTKAVTLMAAGQTMAGVISSKVAALTNGVLKTMLLTKLKTATTAVFLMLGVAGLGAGLMTHGMASARQGGDGVTKAPREAKVPPGEGKGDKGGEGGKAVPKVEADAIAWGKAVEGLQAGIGYRAGEKPSYRVGQSATFVIYLRNVARKTFEYPTSRRSSRSSYLLWWRTERARSNGSSRGHSIWEMSPS